MVYELQCVTSGDMNKKVTASNNRISTSVLAHSNLQTVTSLRIARVYLSFESESLCHYSFPIDLLNKIIVLLPS